jgi:hypothetical protein
VILLLAVLAGLLFKIAKLALSGARLRVPKLNRSGIVVVAFLPQLLAFYLPGVRDDLPDPVASAALLFSQLLLLGFVWINRTQPGFLIFGLGLALNLLVISTNGGFMPISPETAGYVTAYSAEGRWKTFERFGYSKDIVLPVDATFLPELSDRLVLPLWSPYKGPFSVGDLLIVIGTIWFLWKMGEETSLKLD